MIVWFSSHVFSLFFLEKSRISCNSTSQSPLLPSQARGGMVGCMSVPDVNTHNKVSSQSILSLAILPIDTYLNEWSFV